VSPLSDSEVYELAVKLQLEKGKANPKAVTQTFDFGGRSKEPEQQESSEKKGDQTTPKGR
jgi:hypothetical protein